jgi:PAS domain S-box-containing protein
VQRLFERVFAQPRPSARRVTKLSRRWAHLPLRTKGLIVIAIPLASVIATSALFYFDVRREERIIAAVIGSAVAGLIAGFIAMVMFTAGIVRRSERLVHNAERLSREEALLPMPSGKDEMGLLGQGLEEAARLLSTRSKDLRDARAFLEHLITASPVIILRLRAPLVPTIIDYVSPNVERLLGYDVESIVGTREFWGDHVHPEERSSFDAAKEEALQCGERGFEFEGRFLHGNGSWAWIHLLAQIECDEAGSPLSCLAYVTDITDRREAEEATRAAHELAEKSNLAKSEFLSRMSHELRTPLHAILGFAQLLEMDDLDDEQRTGIRQVLNGGRHLLQLIDEVLDISRIEAGGIRLSVEPVNVDEVVGEALDLIRPLAMEHAVSLGETTKSGLYVVADRHKLKQVLLNLMSNGVKYNRSGGYVRLHALAADERAYITVEDSGKGVPGNMLDQVFEPFDRLGAERSGIQGTGLGLALCKALMEAMEGTIGLESEPNQGTRFWIELPLIEFEAQEQEHQAVAGEASAPERDSKTVLYIEDNMPNLRLVERILATRPNIELLVATEGEAGVELAVKHRPDVVLLDLNLPDINGAEVLKRLKGEPSTNDTRVVILSADATNARSERLLQEGADAYLSKPIDVHRFLRVLDKELECRV